MSRTIIIFIVTLCVIIGVTVYYNIVMQDAEKKRTLALASITQQDSSSITSSPIQQKTIKQELIASSPQSELLSKNNFEGEKRGASLRGINWLISNNETIPPDRNGFIMIHKITADDELANKLFQIIKERKAKRKANRFQVDVEINIQDQKYLNWNNELRPIVVELIRKKCNGQESSEGVARVREIISKHQNKIFNSQTVSGGSLLVASYLLNKIGISIEKIHNKTMTDLKTHQNFSIPYIYSLTHIFFTKSDYLSFYLDPKKYTWEINALNATLEKYADGKVLSDVEIDMISEVIISMKLLRLPETTNSEIIYKKLINQQNNDGSWGGKDINIGTKTHHTVVATIALSKFPDRLKEENIFCF